MLSYDMGGRGELALYEYLYRRIRDDILSGELAPDDRLPSKRALAEHLGVSLITVEGAYGQLVAEGYAVARPRRGYYVARLPLPSERAIRQAEPVVEDLSAQDPQVDWVADFTRPSLRAGASAASLWTRALRQAVSQESQDELFAPQPAQGCLRLRRAIAEYLRRSRGMELRADNVVVGAGAQLLYGSIALLLGPGSTVALEDPGWPALKYVYACHGLRALPVGLDEEGIRMDGLRGSGAVMAHVMPSHQFPTGRVTSVARRYELLGWAASNDRWILEDDYDWEYRMAGRPIPALASIDATGRVVYAGTFSKSLSSALRIAFLVLPPELMGRWQDEMGYASATVSTIDQVTLARLLESGDYERHVARYRTQSREVRDSLVAALQAEPLLRRVRIEEADSGLHFVLAMETAGSERQVAAAAARRRVRLAPLSDYAEDPKNLPQDGFARFVMQYDGLDASRVEEVAAAIGQSARGD